MLDKQIRIAVEISFETSRETGTNRSINKERTISPSSKAVEPESFNQQLRPEREREKEREREREREGEKKSGGGGGEGSDPGE